MEITLNGKSMTVTDNSSIAELLESHNLPAVRVAVERNGEIVRRSDFSCIRIKPDDRLEIVTLVGGG